MTQPFRLHAGGSIDRTAPVRFTFDGRTYDGFVGDTVASALLAHGVRLIGRSFKYHRPRGILAIGSDEPNALLRIGDGHHAEPNLRATQVLLYEGLIARSQNRWPSLQTDFAAITGKAAPLIPAGFYNKTFTWPSWRLYEGMIRRAAGMGHIPAGPDPDRYEKCHRHVDVLIAGGGPAGLAAALAAARAGARIILADENAGFGGDLRHGAATIAGAPAADWVTATITELAQRDNVTLLPRATVFGHYRHGTFAIAERCCEDRLHPAPGQPRQRLWTVRAREAVVASGALERPLVFPGNDRPGVMLAGAVGGYLHRYAVLCGHRALVLANNDSAYRTALALEAAGVRVQVADTRHDPSGHHFAEAQSAGLTIRTGSVVTRVVGSRRVRGAKVAEIAADGASLSEREEHVACDVIAMSGGWTPTVHLHAQVGGRLDFHTEDAIFVPRVDSGSMRPAGACNGRWDLADCLAEGLAAGAEAAAAAGFGNGTPPSMPAVAKTEPGKPPGDLRPALFESTRFVDFQNDVTTADIALSVREGYQSVEHLKRYTTLGMGTDQGKLSNMPGLALLAQQLGAPIPEVGTTTYRPPYTPITVGAIVGRDTGELGHPLRRTPAHDWHAEHGAVFADSAAWLRPLFYRQPGETGDAAIAREALAVREAVGVVDVSPLGKIEIRGPDAAELLERLYINAWKSVAVGRGKFGVMLREDGMVFDDGVSYRLTGDHFLMLTSTANASAVMDTIRFHLDTDWRGMDVYATPVTEQWSGTAIAGPKSRGVLMRLGSDIDFANEAFPLMAVRTGTIAGIPARVYRLSFSGELSYEINVPADYGIALWEALLDAGATDGIAPYGTEAMAVLRIEKGHFVVGAEADGRTTPDDLGIGRMLSRKKTCIGQPMLDRPAFKDSQRRQLVGLLTVDPEQAIPLGAHLVAMPGVSPQPSHGHVTSMAYSPTLKRWIALALVKNGRGRRGERLHATAPAFGESVHVEIVDPVFVDPEGTRYRG